MSDYLDVAGIYTTRRSRTMSAKRSGIGNAKNLSAAGPARSRKLSRRSVAPKNSGAAHNDYSAPDSAERLPAANNRTGSGTRDANLPSPQKPVFEDLPDAF